MQRLPHLISSLIPSAQEPLELTVASFRGTATSQRLHLSYAACAAVISWYNQRIHRLATAAAITLPGFPAGRS